MLLGKGLGTDCQPNTEMRLSLPHPCTQYCATHYSTELPVGNNKHPKFELRGGEGCRLFCSSKLPHLMTVSQQFCRRFVNDS